MSFLGLDVGRKRVGIAVSESGIIAQPLASLDREDEEELLQALHHLVESRNIETIVVGVPLTATGMLTDEAEAIEVFSEELEQQFPALTIVLVDETLTSKEAERLGGRSADHDALAAALILEQYLNERSR